MRRILAVAALLAPTPAFAGTQNLVKQWQNAYGDCRADTNYNARIKACNKRDAIDRKLQNNKRCIYKDGDPFPVGWVCK